jgi:hypothetical protein
MTSRLHPQVLHVGFSKCASTYLRAVFRAQPRVHLVFKSGFFTPFLAPEMTFEQYQSLFRSDDSVINVESDEHLTLPGIHPTLGVRSTSLEQFETVADRIKSHLPDVKIVMVIRNQASLMVSRYSEYLITGGSLDFEDFASRLMSDDDGVNRHYQNYYSRLIEMLERRFPRENLLIMLQEAMRERPEATDAAIASVLGLVRLEAMKKGLRSERRSLSVAGMFLLRRLNRILVIRSSIGGAVPETRIPTFIYRNVVRIVRALDYYVLSRLSADASSLLTGDRRHAILAHFRQDNLALQAHYGRDLSKLGYLDAAANVS